jgi:hypothetical protein
MNTFIIYERLNNVVVVGRRHRSGSTGGDGYMASTAPLPSSGWKG